ncbi:hypothetical protein K8I61_16265 [bacterium]|nr:hypothetical protein [bacterium]
MLLPFMIFYGAFVCGILVYLLIQFARMGEDKMETAVRNAERLVEKGRLKAAEHMLFEAMRRNGWNYRAYLQSKKVNKAVSIEQVTPSIVKIARLCRVLPKDTIEWIVPAFFVLGDIFMKQGKTRKATRLYEDMHNFLEGYGEDIAYVRRNKFTARLHDEQARLDLHTGSPLHALRLHLISYSEHLAALKGAGDDELFREQFPYRGDNFLDMCLTAMNREAEREAVVDLVNRSVKNSVGRINPLILVREMDIYFSGHRSREDADFEAARDIIHLALNKLRGEDKDETKGPEEPQDESRKNVIILGR